MPARKPEAYEGPTPEDEAFDAFWAALEEAGRESFEAEDVSSAQAFLQRQYRAGAAAMGSLWKIARRRILMGHFAATREGTQGRVTSGSHGELAPRNA